MVSIRARHRWRAIHPQAPALPTLMVFQSAPAIDGGRSPAPHQGHGMDGRFNPRPPSMAGDPALRGARSRRPGSFNPRPPSMAGDPPCAATPRQAAKRFNPRPPSMAGDPQRQHRRGQERTGFNPRPPSMAGDPRFPRSGACASPVSIRARHRWRAIPLPALQAGDDVGVSIRARHRWRAILKASTSKLKPSMFQSAPAIDGGRSIQWSLCRLPACRFNPRPPSMALICL